MIGHESIPSNRGSIERGTGSVTDSQKLFHAKVLLPSQLKLKELGLTGEVVLVYALVIKGTGVYLKELITFDLVMHHVRIR